MPGYWPGAGPLCEQTLNQLAWSSRTGHYCQWRRCWPGIPPPAGCQSCVTAARYGIHDVAPGGGWSGA